MVVFLILKIKTTNMDKSKIPTVVAILLAGAMIGGAIIYSQKSSNSSQTAGVASETGEVTETNNTPETIWEIIEPVTEKDHVLGSPEAKLTLILYSDIECPYCKTFHKTMSQVIDEYGKDGTLRWVYRHLPLESIHPTAPKEAEATECAAELGGNNAFWEYLNELVETNTPPSQSNLTNDLAKIAEKIGLDKTKFASCLDSNKYASRIAETSAEAAQLGIQGTPFSIIITADGKAAPISGALPYDDIKEAIKEILNNSTSL